MKVLIAFFFYDINMQTKCSANSFLSSKNLKYEVHEQASKTKLLIPKQGPVSPKSQ